MTGDWHDLDPIVRVLRAIAILAFLALLFVVVLDPERAGGQLPWLLIGAILLALGYPIAMRLPSMFGRPTDEEHHRKPRDDQ